MTLLISLCTVIYLPYDDAVFGVLLI